MEEPEVPLCSSVWSSPYPHTVGWIGQQPGLRQRRLARTEEVSNSLQVKVELCFKFGLHLIGSIHGIAFEGWDRLLVGFGCL